MLVYSLSSSSSDLRNLGLEQPGILETFCKLLHPSIVIELRKIRITPSDKGLPLSEEVNQLHRQGRCSFDSTSQPSLGTIRAR